MTQIWVYALVAIALLQTVATVVLYYWLDGRTEGESPSVEATTAPAASQSAGATVDGDGVVCSNCGATNAPGYRYCRQCVQQLGRTAPSSDDDDGPENPWIR